MGEFGSLGIELSHDRFNRTWLGSNRVVVKFVRLQHKGFKKSQDKGVSFGSG